MEQKTERKFIVSVSPHVRCGRTTRGIMGDVIIALIPALAAGCFIFGLRSLAVTAVCVGTALLSEILFNVICKKPQTISDLSAIVTGLLLGMNLPANLPLWQAIIGAVFAIVVVKCLFGGLGKNFANPAITARVMMIISFPTTMGAAVKVQIPVADAAASATPLAILSAGGHPGQSLLDMLLGLRSGAIGETCIAALLLGFIYLLVRRVITWHTPVVLIGTVFLLTWITSGSLSFALYQIMAGGLFIAAIFMATDYVTTPTTAWGKVIFALGCALFTYVVRRWSAYPEGVSFSILLMNIVTPYIEKATVKKPLGEVKA